VELGLRPAVVFGGLSVMMVVGALMSPAVGGAIARHGAGPVLSLGSIVMACGLSAMAMAQGTAGYLLAWVVVGVSFPMTMNLGAYGAIAQVYRSGATHAMTVLGFFTGLTSTIAWPLTSVLQGWLGWRGVCMAFAAIHVVVALPLHRRIPRPPPADDAASGEQVRRAPPARPRDGLFPVLAAGLALNCFLMTGLQVHLLVILQGLGLTAALALSVATLMGPAQVAARALALSAGKRTAAVRMGLWAAGLFCLALPWLAGGAGRLALLVAAVAIMGAAMGLSLPVRATIPYELFGRQRFAVEMGRLGLIQNLASAAAPLAFAFALNRWEVVPSLWLAALAALLSLGALVAVARIARAGAAS